MILLSDARSLPLANGCVQCVVTSPPYFQQRDYGAPGQIGLEQAPSEYVAALVGVFREVRRVLRDDGVVFLNLGDTYVNRPSWGRGTTGLDGRPQVAGPDRRNVGLPVKNLLGIPWRVAFALQDDGWYLRCDIIWNKPNAMPDGATDRPTRSHEYVFLLSKSAQYDFDADAIAEIAINGDGNKPRGSVGSRRPNGGRRDGAGAGERITTRNRRSVWTISTEHSGVEHYATMPTELARLCILAGSRPGDVVFDPFAGSGTTLITARKLGRKAAGCEINPTYAKIAATRLAKTAPGLF